MVLWLMLIAPIDIGFPGLNNLFAIRPASGLSLRDFLKLNRQKVLRYIPVF